MPYQSATDCDGPCPAVDMQCNQVHVTVNATQLDVQASSMTWSPCLPHTAPVTPCRYTGAPVSLAPLLCGPTNSHIQSTHITHPQLSVHISQDNNPHDAQKASPSQLFQNDPSNESFSDVCAAAAP